MKLPFIGVAAIAMCLFISCSSGSSNFKTSEGTATQDVTLANVKPEESQSEETANTTSVSSPATNDITL